MTRSTLGYACSVANYVCLNCFISISIIDLHASGHRASFIASDGRRLVVRKEDLSKTLNIQV